MIEWLFIILLLLYPRRGAYPSSAAARRAWEREAEGDLFKGSVIGGNPQFVHHYEQGAQGTRHSISLRGGISIRPSLRRKLWKRKWHILLSLSLVVITMLTGLPLVLGTTVTWAATGGGAKYWSVAGHWSPAAVPIDGDDVVFDSTSIKNCTMDENSANLNSVLMNTGYTGIWDMVALYTVQVEYVADTSSFTGLDGTFRGGGSTITITGNVDMTGTNFTLDAESCTWVLTGTGTLTAHADAANAFYKLTVAASGKTTTVAANIRCMDQFTTGTGACNQTGGTKNIAMAYNSTSQTVPFVNGGGTLNVTLQWRPKVAFDIAAGTNYSRMTLEGPSSGSSYLGTMQGNITCGNNCNIAGRRASCDTAGYNLTVTGGNGLGVGTSSYQTYLKSNGSTITVNQLQTGTNGWIKFDTSQWYISGAATVNTANVNWDEGTATVEFNGSSAQNINWNGLDIYNVDLSGTGQKNLTGSIKTNNVTAKNDVQVNVTDVAVTWSTFNSVTIQANATYTLTLRSSIPTNAWDMLAGTGNVAYRVDVQDSNNTGTDVDATDPSNTDSDRNIGWTFAAGEIVTLAGSTAGQSGASGATKLSMKILGSTAGGSGADGATKVTMKILGSSAGAGGASAALEALKKIIGSIGGQSGASGSLTITGAIITLQGSSAGQSGTAGALKLTMELVGSIAGGSGASSVIKVTRTIAGTSDAQSTAAAVLKAVREIVGSIAAQSSAAGTLKLTMVMAGSLDAVSSLTGDLTLGIILVRTELDLAVNIATEAAFDGPLHRSLAIDGPITRIKEFEVEV